MSLYGPFSNTPSSGAAAYNRSQRNRSQADQWSIDLSGRDISQKQGSIPLGGVVLGTIVKLFPASKTCNINGNNGAIYTDVPFPHSITDPLTSAGEYIIPMLGTLVRIFDDIGGQRCEIANSPYDSQPDTDAQPDIFPPNGSGATNPAAEANNLTTLMGPSDLEPGDWARIGTEGQAVGVLSGGRAVLKAGSLAQVICQKGSDSVKMIGQNCHIESSFGTLSFTKDLNGTSMKLRGGSHYTTETSPNQENFTIEADLGEAGNLVDFRLNTSSGDRVSSVKYYPTGSVATVAKDRSTQIYGHESHSTGHSRSTFIGKNDMTVIDGSYYLRSEGPTTIQAAKLSFMSADSCSLNGTKDASIHAGRGIYISAGGSSVPDPTSVAYSTSVTNGSMVIDIGNPTAGSFGTSMAGFTVKTWESLGDITLDNIGGGTIALKTTKPADSILLGGQVGVYHAVLYEMLEAYLQQLNIYLDTHTHPTGVGPSGPPLLATATQAFPANMPLMKSLLVSIGG